jgi:hypothetical protein
MASVLVVLTVSALIPFGFSPVTNRPTVYNGNITAEPVQVGVGTTANIDTTGMIITGAQVWLWLSTSGGSGINVALGDRPYAGPFLLSELVDTLTTHTYTFSLSDISALCDSLSVTSPFATEGRTYTFIIGNDWINGTVPLLVQGEDVDYWIKIADVAPADTIAGTEIAVSTNRVHFLPAFGAVPLQGSPGQQVTVSGYAIEATNLYNITQSGMIGGTTYYIAQVTGLTPATTYDESGWLWTGFSVSFNIMDLELKNNIAPILASSVNITLFNNASPTEGAIWYFSEYWREVYMPATQGGFRADGGDYSGNGTLILSAESECSLMLRWFKSYDTADVYLDNILVKSGISLEFNGGATTTLNIPIVPAGDYLLRVVDQGGPFYDFLVHVESDYDYTYLYHDVVFNQTTYVVETCSNSTVSDLAFNQELARIRFNVDGTTGTTGFCNITVPAELMSGDFSLYLDDIPLIEDLDYTKSYNVNGTRYQFSLTYDHSTHVIEIFSTNVIPDFPGWLLLPFLMSITLLGLLLRKKLKERSI